MPELTEKGEGPSMSHAPEVSDAVVLSMEVFAYNVIHNHLFEVSNPDFYALLIAI